MTRESFCDNEGSAPDEGAEVGSVVVDGLGLGSLYGMKEVTRRSSKSMSRMTVSPPWRSFDLIMVCLSRYLMNFLTFFHEVFLIV